MRICNGNELFDNKPLPVKTNAFFPGKRVSFQGNRIKNPGNHVKNPEKRTIIPEKWIENPGKRFVIPGKQHENHEKRIHFLNTRTTFAFLYIFYNINLIQHSFYLCTTPNSRHDEEEIHCYTGDLFSLSGFFLHPIYYHHPGRQWKSQMWPYSTVSNAPLSILHPTIPNIS
jgi:hypothetical protein